MHSVIIVEGLGGSVIYAGALSYDELFCHKLFLFLKRRLRNFEKN